jgi:hypothetical protein
MIGYNVADRVLKLHDEPKLWVSRTLMQFIHGALLLTG